MRRRHTYNLLLIMLLLAGCENPFNKKKTNWVVTLQKDDKKPYGSYLSYQSLKHFFPKAKIENLSNGFRYTSIDFNMHYGESTSLLVLLGLDFYISNFELEELIAFANNGNEVMLFCSRMDNKLSEKLHCDKYSKVYEEARLSQANDGSNNIGALKLASKSNAVFGYEGRSIQGYFDTSPAIDSTIIDSVVIATPTEEGEEALIIGTPDTLGFAGGKPNFVRYAVGDGHITLHAAPLALSNYFLLQNNNKDYLHGIWRTLPGGISQIYWNEYFKHRAEASSFDVLWRYPATRWALIIAIFTLLCYVLFEAKRRQRIIPIVVTPENSSVSFVETVGRLYYNKGNHTNIAEKMIQHFLEWLRTTYHLNTNILNAEFAAHLARKTQRSETDVNTLIEMIHNIRLGNVTVDEPYLYELYNAIQLFYKNEHP